MKWSRILSVLPLITAALPLVSGAQTADTTLGWKRSASGMVNLSQAYFDNWVKGGTDALAWELRFDGNATLKAEKYDWESKVKSAYGQSKLASLGSRKTADELLLETIFTYKLGSWINPFASTSLRTQYTPGYAYDDALGTRARVSGVFDPTYLMQTLGAGTNWRDKIKVRLGGALKETFSSSRYGYADDKKTAAKVETSRFEPGADFTADAKLALMQNISLSSVLNVFANFKGADEIDVRWENLVSAKVNKWVSANLGVDVLYDKDLSTKRQVKESLGIGISFLSL